MTKEAGMKFKDLKKGMHIEDLWYNASHSKENWGRGIILEVQKTRFKVQFSNKNANHSEDGVVVYDRSHAQFVRKIKRPYKKRKLS